MILVLVSSFPVVTLALVARAFLNQPSRPKLSHIEAAISRVLRRQEDTHLAVDDLTPALVGHFNEDYARYLEGARRRGFSSPRPQ